MAPRSISTHKRAYNSLPTINTIDNEEFLANTAILELISNITVLTTRKDPLIRSIKSPKLLIRGLTELQAMVEMVDIKHSIVNQIKFLISNHARKQHDLSSSQFEGHMLHSVISGNPGTGKTTVGMILAKIWMALGFIKKKDTPAPIPPTADASVATNAIVNTINESYRTRVVRLEEDQRNSHRQIDRLREMLTRCQTTSGELRRQAIKLKSRNSEKEWDDFLALARELRFGFDDIIREANIKTSIPAEIIVSPSPTSGNTGASPSEDVDPFENVDPKFIVAAREDLIAEYLGQTAPKTKKVLESARGGVLFIDEAYSLCNMDGGSKDKYGEECLTTINEFMSLHPDEIIIIFAGYKDKLMNSIFKAQPGLFRRCAWLFEIKDYTYRGLAKIFTRQLSRNFWKIAPDVDVEAILSQNTHLIQDGGGGTEKLAFFSKIAYGNSKFEETVNSDISNTVVHDSIITIKMIEDALEQIRKNADDRMIVDEAPPSMYL